MFKAIKKRWRMEKRLRELVHQKITTKDLTKEERDWIAKHFHVEMRHIKFQFYIRRRIQAFIRVAFFYPLNRFRRPVEVVWKPDGDPESIFPFCPICNEFAYEQDRCVFCGRRFIWPQE